MYVAVFFFFYPLTLNGVLDSYQMRDFDVGDITWFHPEAFGVSSFMKWL